MDIEIRPLTDNDIDRAYEIYKLAFGTFLGLPRPLQFAGDAALVPTRYKNDPSAAFGAFDGERLIGANFAARWGTQGGFGPLIIDPAYWDKGIASMLMGPAMDQLDDWRVDHACIFTYATSPKHLALYQKFGFWPRFLTTIMSCPVLPPDHEPETQYYSNMSDQGKIACLEDCRESADEIYRGLDLETEICSVDRQGLGETVMLMENGSLAGFAVCHLGPGNEAPSDFCYVKFGMARPGVNAQVRFRELLDAIFSLASKKGLKRVSAGMNLARDEAFRMMVEYGFRTDIQGVAMHRPNEAGYNLPGTFAIDDRR